MQKKTLIVGAGAAVALSLFAAAPAQAADTVTTSDVAPTAWSQVLNPYTPEAPSDFNYFADYDLTAEPLTFPFVTPNIVLPAEDFRGGFDLAWIAPAPGESCTRVVNGFSVSITNPTAVGSTVGVAFASSTDGLESADPGTVVEPGAPVEFETPGVTVGAVAPETTQLFSATLDAPVAWSSEVSAIVALEGSQTLPHSFTINSVTFTVTDTCAGSVEPAVLTPVTPAADSVQPVLANTGADFGPMAATAAVLLLAGLAAVAGVSATRRIRNPRP